MFSAISYLLIILHLSLLARAEVLPWDDFLTQMQQEDIVFGSPNSKSLPMIKNHIFKSKKVELTAIVFVPGMGEPSLKYYALAPTLSSLSATLYYWDHIGQGFSTHLLPEDLGKTHVPSFEYHVQSLKKFLQSLKLKHSQIFLVTHSMGAHIALRILQEAPELIDKIVCSSPMVDLRRYYIPISFAHWVLSFKTPTDYMWGGSPSEAGHTPFLTHSEERQDIYKKLLDTYPEIKRRWVTVQWVIAALESIKSLNAPNLAAIEKPILMLQAEHELLVSPNSQTDFCHRQKKCTLKKIDGTYHELFVEKDPARQEAMALTQNFLKN